MRISIELDEEVVDRAYQLTGTGDVQSVIQTALHLLLKHHAATVKPVVPHCRLRDEPAIGMWKERQDMQDSTEWVRNLRRNAWQRKKAEI